MTLRQVIQLLIDGSNDAESMLAEAGYESLPADIFSQALASYSDGAPIAEADALAPVLASIEEGDPSDVFAILEQETIQVQHTDSTASSSIATDAYDVFGDMSDDGEDATAFGQLARNTNETPDGDEVPDSITSLDEFDESSFDESPMGESPLDDIDTLDDEPLDRPFDDPSDDESAGTGASEPSLDDEHEFDSSTSTDLDVDF